MRVRMKTHITGHRNEEEWPPVGGVIDVPEHEAADLIGNGYAEAAPEEPDGPGDVDLASLTVPRLRDLAAERGVDLGSAKKKADIIAALEQAEEEEPNAGATGDPGGPPAPPAGPDGAPTDPSTGGT